MNDEKTYESIKTISASTIEKRINKEWKIIANDIGLPKRITRNLTTNNSMIPKFYHLIKTHKKGPEIKIRPIVSNVQGPTRKIAWLLSTILTPSLKYISAHLQDSNELIDKLRNLSNEEKRQFTYPISLDVVSLYTSIPPDDAIDAALNFITNHNVKTYGLNIDHLRKLMILITKNMYLEFNEQIYRQTSGLPMGNCISGALAIIYMDSVEQQAVNNLNIGLYKRYVDDICILTTSKEEAINILKKMNSINNYIKFELELPNNLNSLSLLDITLKIDKNTGQQTINFYRKSARKNIFVNYHSGISTKSKINYIKNEEQRIVRRSDNNEDVKININNFAETLRQNDYLPKIIEQTLKTKSRKNMKKQKSIKKFNFELPYISDNFDNKINNIFKSNKLDVRIYRRSTTLRNILQDRKQAKCKKKHCPINDENICLKKMCVYKATCDNCHNIYIGSTTRHVHTRASEHIQNPSSSIYQHQQQCKSNISFSIIHTTREIVKLRFIEALEIKKQRPKLNTKEESNELNHVIFT